MCFLAVMLVDSSFISFSSGLGSLLVDSIIQFDAGRIVLTTMAAALVAGAIAMFAAIRRRRAVPNAAAPLSADEERRLAEVIDRAP